MIQSDDYKRGWFDGYQAAKQGNPQQPYMPTPVGIPEVKCFKCGMVWKGAMGYYCPHLNCPIQPKVTAATTAQQDSEWKKDHDRSKY